MPLQARDPKQSLFGQAWLYRTQIYLFLLFCIFIFSCAPKPSISRELVTVYSTSAAEPWLPLLYDCAGSLVPLSRVDSPGGADIALRVGEPEFLDMPAFQIDSEEILIVTHRQSPLQNLTFEEARSLFTGQGDLSIEVWVYASGEDVQEVFDRVVMAGRRVTPSARIAIHPQQMSDTLVNESSSVGILPRHWKVGDVREIFTVAAVPVLAITQVEPQGAIRELIACLQK